MTELTFFSILLLLAGVPIMFELLKKFLFGGWRGRGISIIVPFHCTDPEDQRAKNWKWLHEYWRCKLPGAEIIVGHDRRAEEEGLPFSKSTAVNHAVERSHGDILVIVDADGYIEVEQVLHCAHKIREARERGHRLWYVPYRQFYRLTQEAAWKLLHSSPCHPYKFSHPPAKCDIQSTDGSQHGHWYGAGIQIMPREAFDEVGGWDERFRGWGGEDHAAMRAMDTLYWRHKTLPGQFLHVWHPMIGPKGTSQKLVDWRHRMWKNQPDPGANDKLSGRYYGANGHRERMRKLVDDGLEFKNKANKS